MALRSRFLDKLHHGGVSRILLDILNRCRLTVMPYVLFQEQPSAQSIKSFAPGFQDYTVAYLEESDLPAIAAIPGRTHSLQQLERLLCEGKICLGLKCKEEIVAFSWCDLQECRFVGDRFELRTDEAYLFDAYTSTAYRGKSVAPYLRAMFYSELAAMGRQKIYNVSGSLNKPALRFKQKLGARRLRSGIYFDLFGILRFRILLKDYEAGQES